MTLPVHFIVALPYVPDFTTPLYLCLRTIARVTRVRDEVSDVTSVNIMLHQYTGSSDGVM